MLDKFKLVLAGLLLVSSLVLPMLGLLYGWWQWDAVSGILLMVGTFLILIIISGFLLLSIKNITWFSVFLPYIFGTVYGFLPDSIVFSFDDAVALTAGAIFTQALTFRKQPGTPRWIILPLLAAGVYAFIGGYIPGTIDELFVDVIGLLIAWLGTRQGSKGNLKIAD